MAFLQQLSKTKDASRLLPGLPPETRTKALLAMSGQINRNMETILDKNKEDMAIARTNQLDASRLAILELTKSSIKAMAETLIRFSRIPDTINHRTATTVTTDGLVIEKRNVPLGVVGIIYEARPDVVTDAAALCVRSGNALVLSGSRHSHHTDKYVTGLLQQGLEESGINSAALLYIDDCSHAAKQSLSRFDRHLDLLILRGGHPMTSELTRSATVPVVRAGEGNCHIYIDDSADYQMAEAVVLNSKVPRPKACNAAETILVHKSWGSSYLEKLINTLVQNNIEIYGCGHIQKNYNTRKAEEIHWQHEFFAPALAVKVVDSIEDAIHHINQYRTPHTETIISENSQNVSLFMHMVEANVICHNAATRFTDGIQLGLGGEAGISTQKFGVSGPIGIAHLSAQKYFIHGNGHLRT